MSLYEQILGFSFLPEVVECIGQLYMGPCCVAAPQHSTTGLMCLVVHGDRSPEEWARLIGHSAVAGTVTDRTGHKSGAVFIPR